MMKPENDRLELGRARLEKLVKISAHYLIQEECRIYLDRYHGGRYKSLWKVFCSNAQADLFEIFRPLRIKLHDWFNWHDKPQGLTFCWICECKKEIDAELYDCGKRVRI